VLELYALQQIVTISQIYNYKHYNQPLQYFIFQITNIATNNYNISYCKSPMQPRLATAAAVRVAGAGRHGCIRKEVVQPATC
jgi:hypothetical protein